MTEIAPVVTIDGPSGVGKGTMSRMLATELGWHYLDSGALYRLVACSAGKHSVALDDEASLAALAQHMDAIFAVSESSEEVQILLEGEDVTRDLRTETCGNNASKVAALTGVRAALLERQREYRKLPGLVADGRDMGTVVFPEAELKLFLSASAEIRGERRYKQLKEKGSDVNLTHLIEEIALRDERDRNRSISPLKPADDAVVIDTSDLSIEAVFSRIQSAVSDIL